MIDETRDTALRPDYDRVAHLYDVDMAQNMRFDDVGFYVRACVANGGRALEIGCGNGRILLELMSHGIDAIGIDRSQKMLAALIGKASDRALHARVCAMDARNLGFDTRFDVVLCPYSLITYMASDVDAVRMLDQIAGVLNRNGRVVVDAFVPRPVQRSSEFTRDYVRPFGEHALVRSKRITPRSDRVNRIERRYEIVSTDGTMIERIDTREDIRVYTRDQLIDLLSRCRFAVESMWWDYASTTEPQSAQFFTAIARISR